MRRTLNEVYRACQKAAEGAGAPTGLDMDAAQAAVWLESRGLDPIDAYAAELGRMSGQEAPCIPAAVDAGPQSGVDASGKVGLLIAPELVDLLVAESTAGGQSGRLSVSGLSAPLFLLPPAARYAEEGWSFRFKLADETGRRFVLTVAPDAGVTIAGPAGVEPDALSGSGPFSLEMLCVGPAESLPDADETDLSVLAGPASLAAKAAESRAQGVTVGAEAWSRLQPFVARTLVPATEESRRRGAGSRLSDNE